MLLTVKGKTHGSPELNDLRYLKLTDVMLTYNCTMSGSTRGRGGGCGGGLRDRNGCARTESRVGYLRGDPGEEVGDSGHDGGGSGQTALNTPRHDADGVVVVSVLEDDAAAAVSITCGVYRR